MPPGRNRRISFPEPGDERPSGLSADGLVLGPLVGEDGTDMGTYDFRPLLPDCPLGVVLPLVAGLARAAGPGGSWRTRSSVRAGAQAVRSFARHVVALFPQLEAIADLTPEMYRTWFRAVRSRSEWPGRLVHMRTILEHTDGVSRETLQAVRTMRVSKPHQGASVPYTRSEFRRSRSALRATAFATYNRVVPNAEYLNMFRAGDEPNDAPRWFLTGEVWSKGQILDYVARTGRLPEAYLEAGVEVSARVRASLGCGPWLGARTALFPRTSEVFAVAALMACEKGWNKGSILSLALSSAEPIIDGTGRRAAYRITLDKPRRGPQRRYDVEHLTGRQARLWEMAVALTQPARETLATLGYPSDQLLIATSPSSKTSHPTGVFVTDWLTQAPGSIGWHRKAQLVGDDGSELRVSLARIRKTWLGMHRRPTQNTRRVLEESYLRSNPEIIEIARDQVEDEQANMVAGAGQKLVRQIGVDRLAAARDGVEEIDGVSPDTARDILSRRLDTPGGVACLDIHHSPHPEDDGGDCTVSPLMCLACPNAVSTPAHLPQQLALAQALENAVAALYGTSRVGQYDLHFLRLKSLIKKATPGEIREARAAITTRHIEYADRLLRREFDVW